MDGFYLFVCLLRDVATGDFVISKPQTGDSGFAFALNHGIDKTPSLCDMTSMKSPSSCKADMTEVTIILTKVRWW